MLVRVLLIFFLTIGVAISQSLEVRSNDGLDKFLGNMSGNELDPNSISNPLGPYGNPLSADSIHNPLGRYGSPLSPYSPTNPLSVHGPKIVTPDGQYLGNLTRIAFTRSLTQTRNIGCLASLRRCVDEQDGREFIGSDNTGVENITKRYQGHD